MILSQRNQKRIVCAFFPIYTIIYLLLMFKIKITGYIGTPLIALIFLCSLAGFAKKMPSSKGLSLFNIWACYCLLSIFMYVINGMPLACYMFGLQHYFFPLLFFYIGYNKIHTDDSFYNSFLISCVLIFFYGFYLYFVTPSYYTSYLAEMLQSTWYFDNPYVDESTIMSIQKFSSFMSSPYVTCVYSISLMSIAFGFLFRDTKFHQRFLYVMAIVGLIGAFLCQQRIAIASSLILILVFGFYGKLNRNNTIIYVGLFVVALFFAFLSLSFLDERISYIAEMINGRIEAMDFSKAMDARSGQYMKAADEIFAYILLGKGMGAGGHSAVSHGFFGVCDGEVFHFILEFGVLGFLIFVCLAYFTLVKAIKNIRMYIIEICIIVFFLLSFVGANTLSQSYLIGPIFWFCVGRVWNKYYYEQRYKELLR